MRIEPRSAWGARPPKSVQKIAPTPRLFLHHSVTGTGPTAQILRQIQNYHMDGRGWNDFAYSFAVDIGGRGWTGRGPLVAGGHTAGYNTTSHAVVAIGNFQTTNPTPALLEGLAQIAAHGYRQGWWTCRGYTGGHRMVASTACPGDRLNAAIPAINRRVNELLTGTKPAPPPSKPTGGLTMSDINTIITRLDRIEKQLKTKTAPKAIALRAATGDDKRVWVLGPDGTRRHLPNAAHKPVSLLTFLGVLVPGGTNNVHPIAKDLLDMIPIAGGK